MSTTDLKHKLLERLKSIENAYLLEEFLGLLYTESIEDKTRIPPRFVDRLK